MSPSRRAWLVWSVGIAAYIVAVLQRTSLGVAGLEATDRFETSASVLASFTVVQLVVYAGLQVPAGLLLDRFGPRTLIASGAVLMALGQALLAVSPNVPLALVGRVLVGAGDAVTFISMLRLVTAWLPPRRVPVMTQVTGILGQVGQLLSAVPFVALLHLSGWTSAFLAAAGLSVFVGILVVLVVRDSPTGSLRRHDAVTLAAGRPRPAVRLAAPRHPARPVDPLHHPVLRHRLRAAVGIPVPRLRRGPVPGQRVGPVHAARARRRPGGAVPRRDGAAAPAAPVLAGARPSSG